MPDPSAETAQERGHRQLIELLNELRVALPGVQVLFAFLLAVPFTSGWDRVTTFQKDLYFATLLCSATASAFLIAPSAIHRLGWEHGQKDRIVRTGHLFAIIGLTFLALAMVGVVWLITDLLYGGIAVVAFTGGIAAVFVVCWYVVPIAIRRSGDRGPHEDGSGQPR